jgi:glycogen debranching enzyme
MTIDARAFEGATPVPTPSAAATLIQGRTFCLSNSAGDISPDLPHGLFCLDSRIMSRFEVLVNGAPLESLAVEQTAPFAATFISRAHPFPGHADAHLVVRRGRAVGRGMREQISIVNHGLDPHDVTIDLYCAVDFAHVFAVKQGSVERPATGGEPIDIAGLRFNRIDGSRDDIVTLTFDEPGTVQRGLVSWHLQLAPGERWEVCAQVALTSAGRALEPQFRCDATDEDAAPVILHSTWQAGMPDVESDDDDLDTAVDVSADDLGSLRIFDPEHPEWAVLAAGAPWFMTVFGRDSLLTAWMTLIGDPDVAEGALRILARLQGTRSDEVTEEEPGKILHEVRATGSDTLSLEHADVYFGSIDATPLFVMLVGELNRWHPDNDLIEEMLPHVDRAMNWITTHGDRDGDGFVEYRRRGSNGLINQGWKDSWDAIRYADGGLAEAPIALCEVQAYVYGAYRARASIAEELDDPPTAAVWHERADELRAHYDQRFWDEELGCHVLALDGDKRPVRVVTSNAGHGLWTGIVQPERAERLADRLLEPDMFSGFGVRTLSANARAYNPISYHNGSIWPHDNALIAEGMSRYGLHRQANRIIRAQLDVARALNHRLPELHAGFDRADVSVPAAYPASCSPQAWAAAAPLLWLRSILRLDVGKSGSRLWIDPHLPPGMEQLRLDGLKIAERELTVTVEEGRVGVEGGDGLEIRLGRHPLR